MVKHSDRSYVPEYSDIVLGSMDGVISVLATYPKMISEIDDNSRIMTLDDFRKEIESDNLKGAGIDLCFVPDMYADYIEETNEELKEEKIELQAELKHCLKLNPFTSKIDTEFGAIDFFMCRRDTEGCRFSIIPHEWICHIRDADNSPLLTIYGSVYSEASDGSANSRQMFEICDMHTHQELHMYSGYRDLLQKSIDEGNEDMEDPDELMDTQLWDSPMVFVQYMKRNMSREDMKGAGLFALKHSLSCIHENLGGDGISVIVCPEIYGYFKKGEKRTALTKIRNMLDAGLIEEGFICNRIEYLKFEM
jgi:hypothetical protein